jgi:hypothetical protein
MKTATLAVLIALTAPALAGDSKNYPDGPMKDFFRQLKRPDNHLNPSRRHDLKSQFCCDEADTVKTKFTVVPGGGPHPEDSWFAWLGEKWVHIPPEKISPEYAPDGQAYLFLLAGTIQCFVRPRGGL